MRLVFLGDSLTWGGYGGNFVAEIQQRCPQHEVINEGQGGNTIINLVQRIDDVLNRDPDGIFIMIGGNDVLSYTQPATRPYYHQAQDVPLGTVTPAQFEQAYRDLLTRIQLNHTLAWIGLPPAEYSPSIVTAFQQYNDMTKRLARTFNIETIDLMAHFLPPKVDARPDLTLKDINRIGRRTRDAWSDYEQDRQAGGFTFTFDGFHLMPNTAHEIAAQIVDFLNLC